MTQILLGQKRSRIVAIVAATIVACCGLALALGLVRIPLSFSNVHGDLISVRTYYKPTIHGKTAVFDLRDVSPDSSTANVLWTFINFVRAIEDREFNEVRLAWRGDTRFIMEGIELRILTLDLRLKSDVAVLQSLPARVLSSNRKPAFPSWSGGWLGVASAQIGDLHEMARLWYLDDLRASW